MKRHAFLVVLALLIVATAPASAAPPQDREPVPPPVGPDETLIVLPPVTTALPAGLDPATRKLFLETRPRFLVVSQAKPLPGGGGIKTAMAMDTICQSVQHGLTAYGVYGVRLWYYGQYARWCFNYPYQITDWSHSHINIQYDAFWIWHGLTNDFHGLFGGVEADAYGTGAWAHCITTPWGQYCEPDVHPYVNHELYANGVYNVQYGMQ